MISSHPSLYLHIPFCSKWCSYCAFYSEEARTWKGQEVAYVDRMEKEIKLVKERAGGSFDTVFFGGGNPLCLSPESLLRLLQAAGKSHETTIEMNPESLTEAYEPLFASGLVNRVSMGIQSMDQGRLTVLGRNSSWAQNILGIEMVTELKKRYGILVNFDMMTCLPGESEASAIEDIDKLLGFSSFDHLSLYALTMEKETPLARQVREGKLHLPSDKEQASLLFALWHHLEECGFSHYEVSNFAKDGKWCRHNLRYWNLLPYVGLGSHAASRVRRDGLFLDVLNKQSLHQYAHGAIASGYEETALNKNEEMDEYLLVSLRTRFGIVKADFADRFHEDFDQLFKHSLRSLPDDVYQDTPDRFTLTEQGLMVLNRIVLSLSSAY